MALLSSRLGVTSVTKWIYSIMRRLLGLPPFMTLPESAGIKAEVRQWREEGGQGGLKKRLGHTAARAGGQGEGGAGPKRPARHKHGLQFRPGRQPTFPRPAPSTFPQKEDFM